jgi:hypothetical protein
MADSVAPVTKQCILSAVFSAYFELKLHPELRSYAEILLQSLMRGGRNLGQIDEKYLSVLRQAFERYDKIPHQSDHVKEVEARLTRGG